MCLRLRLTAIKYFILFSVGSRRTDKHKVSSRAGRAVFSEFEGWGGGGGGGNVCS